MGSRIETVTMNDSDKICLSFAGCGFTGVYHIGVASCLQLCALHLLRCKIGGSSSGAMCALVLTCNVPLEDVTRFVISLSMKAKENTLGPFSPSFQRLLECILNPCSPTMLQKVLLESFLFQSPD